MNFYLASRYSNNFKLKSIKYRLIFKNNVYKSIKKLNHFFILIEFDTTKSELKLIKAALMTG